MTLPILNLSTETPITLRCRECGSPLEAEQEQHSGIALDGHEYSGPVVLPLNVRPCPTCLGQAGDDAAEREREAIRELDRERGKK